MSNKTPAIISAILTIVLLILAVILFFFFQMVLLNGASERQGVTVMSISLACQGIGTILLAIFAGWLTNLMIVKFKLNKTLAVVIPVILAVLAGGFISFLSIFIALPFAGL